MKIEEKDLLWFFYKRAFYGEIIPAPGNICFYFWNAIYGAILWFLADLFILIPVMVFIGFGWASYNALLVFGPIENSLLCSFLSLIFGMGFISSILFFVGVVIYRWYKWWNGYAIVQQPTLILFLLLILPFFIALTECCRVENQENSVGVINAFLTVLGIEIVSILIVVLLLGIIYLFFTDQTNLGKNLLTYLKSLKDRTCILVEPPQSFLDEQRARDMNVTDS